RAQLSQDLVAAGQLLLAGEQVIEFGANLVPLALDVHRPRKLADVIHGSVAEFRVLIVEPLGPFGDTHKCPIHEPRPAQSGLDTCSAPDRSCHQFSLSVTAISQYTSSDCKTLVGLQNVSGVGQSRLWHKESSEKRKGRYRPGPRPRPDPNRNLVCRSTRPYTNTFRHPPATQWQRNGQIGLAADRLPPARSAGILGRGRCE